MVRHHIIKWWMAKGSNLIQSKVWLCRLIQELLYGKSGKKDTKAGLKMSTHRILFDINQQLIMTIYKQFPIIHPSMNWDHFLKIMDLAKYQIIYTPVKWLYPNTGFIKLNTDGCSKGNPGLCGGGGIIRNAKDLMIAAFGSPLGINTSNMAEAGALNIGID